MNTEIILPDYEPVTYDEQTNKYYFFDETRTNLIGPYDNAWQAERFVGIYFGKGNHHLKKRMKRTPVQWD